MVPAPQGKGGWLTLSIRVEEEGKEQQQWPGYVHHPAAWHQHTLAAWNHCLRSRSKSGWSEISAGTLSEPVRGVVEEREERQKTLRLLALFTLSHHNHQERCKPLYIQPINCNRDAFVLANKQLVCEMRQPKLILFPCWGHLEANHFEFHSLLRPPFGQCFMRRNCHFLGNITWIHRWKKAHQCYV